MKIRTISCLLLAPLMLLASCAMNENQGGNSKTEEHDSSAWFTDAELEKIGLSGLECPTNIGNDISTSLTWFNQGYAFSASCESEDVLKENATTIFNYLETNYQDRFGKPRLKAISMDYEEQFFRIENKTDMEEYKDTNPSPLYKFYYVTDTTLAEDGYFKDHAVYSIDIRYELSTDKDAYLLKIFFENASKSTNGMYTFKYQF